MSQQSIKVSVVTPVFNGAKTIAKCISSVKSQDYPNIEHIVIDGCSSDDTVKIVEDYGVAYQSEPDTGVYDAFNKGVKLATGDIVHILNADDFYADLLALHDGKSEKESADINARLILLLANHIGDRQVLAQALKASVKPGS